MTGSDAVHTVKRLLTIYLQSPSLKHLRHETSVNQLAEAIGKELQPQPALWTKWTTDRQTVVERAAGCWLPLVDLVSFLNSLAGPRLTRTDVSERLKHEEDLQYQVSKEQFRSTCEALYRQERQESTEFYATVCRVRAHLEAEQDKYETEREEWLKRKREEEYQDNINRLMSGADTKWTQHRKSRCWYCRVNARIFRLSRVRNGRWKLERVNEINDSVEGVSLGVYDSRKEVTTLIKTIAYRPDFK